MANHAIFQMIRQENTQLKHRIQELEKTNHHQANHIQQLEGRLEAAAIGLEMIDLIRRCTSEHA